MTRINKSILNTLLVVDIGVVLFCMLSGERDWLYTTQVGFLSSTLIIVASMTSYRRMIQNRLESGMEDESSLDAIDRIDDPHDLYSEEVSKETQELSKEESAQIINEERAKQKAQKRSISEVLRDSKAFLSIYRIGAYGFLVIGFLYLNRNGYLHIPSYIFSLTMPLVIVVILLMREGRKINQKDSEPI